MCLSLPPVWRFAPALRALARGDVIAYPTEAVYGLGCLPDDEQAVMRLLRMKHRSPRKGLILVAATADQILPYVEFPQPDVRDRVLASWPGPVTWLLPVRYGVPAWLTGAHPTLAIRVSAHPAVQALCQAAGPLVSTSANPAGSEPARSTARVRSYFGRQVAAIAPGPLGGQAKPTEIRDAVTGRRIRAGG